MTTKEIELMIYRLKYVWSSDLLTFGFSEDGDDVKMTGCHITKWGALCPEYFSNV